MLCYAIPYHTMLIIIMVRIRISIRNNEPKECGKWKYRLMMLSRQSTAVFFFFFFFLSFPYI
ncbi:hypothetical protein F4703DRAFT_1862409, partial [Phycomyces blakesleeanus]